MSSLPWRGHLTLWTSPQDKAKVEIRKLSSPPQAEAVRDMVRYARNVIEEFRRAKHYKYNLSVCPFSRWQEVVGSWGGRRRRGRKKVSCGKADGLTAMPALTAP